MIRRTKSAAPGRTAALRAHAVGRCAEPNASGWLPFCLKCCTWLLQSHVVAETKVSRKGGGDSSWENGKECIMKQDPKGQEGKGKAGRQALALRGVRLVVVCMLQTSAPPRCKRLQIN